MRHPLFPVEDVDAHAHRPQRAIDRDALADLGRLVASAIKALRPDYFGIAFRMTQVTKIRGVDFAGVYPNNLTAIGGIWRGFEEAGLKPASVLVGVGYHFGISP